jgi:hypothetical protein
MPTFGWIGISLALATGAFIVLSARVGHPRHRLLATGIWVLSWIPLVISFFTHKDAIEARTELVEDAVLSHLPHIAVVLFLLMIGYLVRVLFPTDKTAARELNEEELKARVEGDLAQLVFVLDKADAALDALIAAIPPEGTISAHENALLRERWATFIEASFELEVLKAQYRGFYSLNPLGDAHARCFLVAYAAFVAHYRAALLVTKAVGSLDIVRTILDETQPLHGIREDSYLALQRHSVHPDTLVRLGAGRAYLKIVKDRVEKLPVYTRMRAYLDEMDELVSESPDLLLENPLDYLERLAFDAWFPIQKNVTLGISAVQAPSREPYIAPEHLTPAHARLEPGDTLLMRREWHLTNLGIPGYWTHAALYIGTLDVLDRYFADLHGKKRASRLIKQRFPKAYRQMLKKDARGHRPAVIEAIGAGVSLNPLEKSGLADSLCALRPMIDKKDKWQAVLDSLEHLGKPYDYAFDFASDNAIICSELVYKAYHRAKGIVLEPEVFNGRLLLSPNAFCEKFDKEYDTPQRQLELALFLDGVARGQIEDRDAAALRESHKRPKWHILFADEA